MWRKIVMIILINIGKRAVQSANDYEYDIPPSTELKTFCTFTKLDQTITCGSPYDHKMHSIILLLNVVFALLGQSLKLSNDVTLPVLANSVSNMPGGVSGVHLSNSKERAEYERLVGDALVKIQADSTDGDQRNFVPIKLIAVTRQVVAGLAYEFLVYVGQSTCSLPDQSVVPMLKAHDASIGKSCPDFAHSQCSNCFINTRGQFGLCYIRFIEQAWLHEQFIDKYICKEVRAREALS